MAPSPDNQSLMPEPEEHEISHSEAAEAQEDKSREIEVIKAAILRQSSYQGPIPNPKLLKEFDNVLPGCAERIVSMAEQQSTHRMFLERTVVVSDSRRANQGLWVGGFIALLFLIGSVFLIYNNHDWAGGTLGTASLASLVGVFIYGTERRRSERIEKNKQMQSANQAQEKED